MAKYGPSSVTIQVDDSGGTPRDLSANILTINGFKVNSILEDSNGFGVSWRESLAVGIRFVDDIVLGGFYDDATNDVHAVLSGVAATVGQATRTFQLTYGGGLSSSVECNIMDYARNPAREGLTRFEATLKATGAVTEV